MSCVNREVGLGSDSLSHSSPVSVDVKHHKRKWERNAVAALTDFWLKQQFTRTQK